MTQPLALIVGVGDGLSASLARLLHKEGYAGLEAVREEGRGEGRKEGHKEGETQGMARAILTVLASRGLEIDADSKARLETCRDTETLERWLARATTAHDVAKVFGVPPSS